MSMEKLYQSVVQLQASSRVSELHFKKRMQIWQNMFVHVELGEKPNKKSKKSGANGSVEMLKDLKEPATRFNSHVAPGTT